LTIADNVWHVSRWLSQESLVVAMQLLRLGAT
jgi:hypothetical protein